MNLDTIGQNSVEEPNYETSTFTNIDHEDFEGCWGSTLVDTGERDAEGRPILKKEATKYLIKAGETKTFPSFLVDHFAVQLANKILLRQTGDFADSPQKKSLIEQIKSPVKVSLPVEEEETAPIMSHEEILAEIDNSSNETFEGLAELETELEESKETPEEEAKKVVRKPRTKKVS